MRKVTFATIAASVLAAFSIGLAAPAFAVPPADNGQDTVAVQDNGYPMDGQTPYGTYQNPHKRG